MILGILMTEGSGVVGNYVPYDDLKNSFPKQT